MATVTLNVITAAAILNEAIAGLQNIGVLDTDGNLSAPTVLQDVQIATLAEAISLKHGVKVPTKLDRLIKILPLALELVN